MNDYSALYTANKNSEIIIAKNNVMIKFKPFLETYAVQVSSNTVEVTSIDNITQKVTGLKEKKYQISFNVPSLDHNDSINNHKKFQKLLRMTLPDDQTRESEFYLKFANLIRKDSEKNNSFSDYESFSEHVGVKCKLSSLNYSPDLEMGFFDEGGMFFAKNYKLDFDLEVMQDSYPRNKKYSKKKRDKKDKLIKPGNLFGFDINYN